MRVLQVTLIESIRLLTMLVAIAVSLYPAAIILILIELPLQLVGLIPQLPMLYRMPIILLIAYGPFLLALNVPAAAAALYDTKFGARRLSSREQELIGKVADELRAASGRTGIKLPQIVWRVQDTGEVNAYAYAHNRVCFTKGLLHTYGSTKEGIERLAGIAAHEIGHLRNWDTRIGMFLDYLTKPVNIAISALNNTVGRIPYAGLLFIALAWAFRIAAEIAHFLQSSTSQLRELEADHFAHRLMGGIGISGFLDDAARQEEWSGGSVTGRLLRSHPAAELRHDRLQKVSSAAARSEA